MSKTLIYILLLAFCVVLTSQECASSCIQVSEGCCSCDSKATFCYSCNPGYYYDAGLCLKNPCSDSEGSLCETNGNCISCSLGYYCYGSCFKIGCRSNCSLCLSQGSCVQCSSGFTLSNEQCLANV